MTSERTLLCFLGIGIRGTFGPGLFSASGEEVLSIDENLRVFEPGAVDPVRQEGLCTPVGQSYCAILFFPEVSRSDPITRAAVQVSAEVYGLCPPLGESGGLKYRKCEVRLMTSTSGNPNPELERTDLSVLSNRLHRPRSRRLGELRRWLFRCRARLLRQTEQHPVVSTCLLTGMIFLGFLLGVAGACRSAGPSSEAAPAAAASPPVAVERQAAAAATASASRPDVRPRRRDVARELIANVIAVNYTRRDDIATGRFLADFENQWALLLHVDPAHFQPLRRGARWVQVLASYRPPESRSSYRSYLLAEDELQDRPGDAIIRIVKEDKTWKLEHIRIEEREGE